MSAPSPRTSLAQLAQPIPLCEGQRQRPVQRIADHDLVQVRHGRMTEPLCISAPSPAVRGPCEFPGGTGSTDA